MAQKIVLVGGLGWGTPGLQLPLPPAPDSKVLAEDKGTPAASPHPVILLFPITVFHKKALHA